MALHQCQLSTESLHPFDSCTRQTLLIGTSRINYPWYQIENDEPQDLGIYYLTQRIRKCPLQYLPVLQSGPRSVQRALDGQDSLASPAPF